MMESSIFIMGDQLDFNASALNGEANNVVMVESANKCRPGKWHKRRVAFVISAMPEARKALEKAADAFLHRVEAARE